MKTRFILLAAAAVLLSAGNNYMKDARVKNQYHIHITTIGERTETDGGLTDTFYYTPDGKADYAAQGLSYKEQRKGNVITRTTTGKDGIMINTATIILNAHGLEDSVVVTDTTQRIWRHKYLYDTGGNLIEDHEYLPRDQKPQQITTRYKVVNGNRFEESIFLSPAIDTVYMPNPQTGIPEQTIQHYNNEVFDYEYFINKPNMPVNINFAYPDAEKDSKNLVKKSVQLTEKGDTMDVYFYSYTFDTKGRVTSKVQESQTGQDYDSTAYSYY